MRNYEERAKDFIKMIYPVIEDCKDVWDYRNAIRMFNNANSRKIICGNGCARIALITSDYVVKFEYDEEEVDRIGGGENEIEMYKIAEAEGFAYMFAKVTRYEYMGKRFYIMPRINGIGRNPWSCGEKYMTPEEKQFCEFHQLTDLHSKNYGFRKGHICIVDYACVETMIEGSESWS
jgi:hypothetical protein